MAVSAWTVMINLNTRSTLPKQLGAISQAVRDAGKEIDQLKKKVDELGERITAANGPLAAYAASLRSIAKSAQVASGSTAASAAAGFAASGAAAARATQNVSRFAVALSAAQATASYALPGSRAFSPLALASGGGRGGGGMINVTPGAGFGGPGGPRINRAYPIGGGGFIGGGGGGGTGGGGGNGGGSSRGSSKSGFQSYLEHRAIMYSAEVATGTLIDAVSSAATMQKALLGVQNATGATDSQLLSLRQKAFNIGDMTGMTGAKSAELLAVIARSSGGVFTKKDGSFDMGGFMAVAPTIAEIAKIQNLTRGTETGHAAQTVVQLMHLFRTYSGKSMQQTGDLVTRLSEMMPDSLDVAMRQFTYFLPMFKALGISDKDSVASMALLDRMGYGRGKGGTNIADLISASLGGLQMTTHAQIGKEDLLRKIGIIDKNDKSIFFTNSGANLTGFLEQLNKFASTHGRVDTVKDFKSAFGIQGSRIADLALDPQFIKQIALIKEIMNNPKISLFAQFGSYGHSADFQMQRGFANMQSVLTEIGWQLLPGVTAGFKQLADSMHDAQLWLHTHRQVEHEMTVAVLDMAHRVGPALQMLGDLSIMSYHSIKSFGWELTLLDHILDMTIGLIDGFAKAMTWLYVTWENFASKFHIPSGDPAHSYGGLRLHAGKNSYIERTNSGPSPVGARPVRRVGRLASTGQRHEIHLTIGGNGTSQFDGMSQKDLKRLARAIMDVASNDVELDSRGGGNTPQLVGQSHYSITQGRVA